MGFFGSFDPDVNNEDEVYDEDEYDELLEDSELFFEAPPLESIALLFTPKDIMRFDAAAALEYVSELPYEFRMYFDTRRAFTRAYDICREEITGFESYEGGRSAEYKTGFDYDDHDITIDFSMSRESNGSPYVFSANIKVDE